MKKTIHLLAGAGITMCLVLGEPFRTSAQETIDGTVLSAEDNSPLPGATISLSGTSKGTTTNENGRFRLFVDGTTPTLSITFLGYRPLDTALHLPLNTPLVISLQRDVSQLEGVVVSTGYQQLSPERTTGSFTQPDEKMFNARVSTDVISRLEGITSGLVFNGPGTMSAGRQEVLAIRGRSTIYANSQPLIVVDNFPYEGDINNINPNDVESITVLKDAAAASIWGARSGNGVIVITTKKGRKNTPPRLSFNINTSVSDNVDLFYDPHFISSEQLIDLEMTLYQEGFYERDISSSRKPVISPVVALLHQVDEGQLTEAEAEAKIQQFRNVDIRNDLSEYFYRPAINQQYALSLSGGSEAHRYYMSAGYDKNLQSLKGNDFSRLTLNFSDVFTPLKNLTLTAGINYVQSWRTRDNSYASATNAFKGAVLPYTSVADEKGNPLPVITGYSPLYTSDVQENGFLDWQFYPLDELNNGYDLIKTQASDIRLIGGVEYIIFKGLKASVKYQYQRGNTLSRNLSMLESYYSRNLINRFSIVDEDGNVIGNNIPVGAILNRGSAASTANNIRAQLDYTNDWGPHQVTTIAGIEAREIIGESERSRYYEYDDETATFGKVNTTTRFDLNPSSSGFISDGLDAGGTIDRFRSFYANAAYTYDNRYTVSLSGRIDQSNLFGVRANQRNVPLWSAGGKWNISEETFYRLNWLPKLSLRASYGFNGNMDKSVTAITTFQSMGSSAGGITTQPYARISNLGNPDLRWEKIGMMNLGIDFIAINGAITGSIEYFRKRGVDLMGDEVMPKFSGIDVLRGNYAKMKGRGFDLLLNTQNLHLGRFSWESALQFSWAADEVTAYSVEALPVQLVNNGKTIVPHVGNPVYSIITLKWAGLDPETGAPRGYDDDGNISMDYNVLMQPAHENSLVYHGPARPTIFGGLRNTFRYGNLSLSFNINYKMGYYFMRDGISYSRLFDSYQMHRDYSQRWRHPGDERSTNIPSMVYPGDSRRDSFYGLSEVMVERGDHIRLQDLSLSYRLHPSWLKSKITNPIELFGYVNHIGLLWRESKRGLDPDYPTGGIVPSRTIAIGLKAQF